MFRVLGVYNFAQTLKVKIDIFYALFHFYPSQLTEVALLNPPDEKMVNPASAM